jgi:hypothetical protein
MPLSFPFVAYYSQSFFSPLFAQVRRYMFKRESAMRNKVRFMLYVIVVYIFLLHIKPLTCKFPNDLPRSNTFRMNYVTASDTRKTSAATWSCNKDVKTTSGGKKWQDAQR